MAKLYLILIMIMIIIIIIILLILVSLLWLLKKWLLETLPLLPNFVRISTNLNHLIGGQGIIFFFFNFFTWIQSLGGLINIL
jgi:hypothetical protein